MSYLAWREALLSVICEICTNRKINVFRRAELKNNHLDKIILLTGSEGKTPDQTLSKELQLLIKQGYICRQKPGVYVLTADISKLQLEVHSFKLEPKGSSGQKAIRFILSALCVTFEEEKSFPDLRHVNPLRYDFYGEISSVKFAIEFDGEGHYKPISYYGGKTAFIQGKLRDEIKTNYSQNRGIFLLRIPFWEKKKINFIVTRFLLSLVI